MKVAIAQTCPTVLVASPAKSFDGPVFPAITARLQDVVSYVQRAAAQGTDIVLFPEYFLQGILNDCRYDALPSRHLEAFLVRLAAEHGVWIAGTIVHGTSTAPGLRNQPTQSPFEHISLRVNDEHERGKVVPLEAPCEGDSAWGEYLRAAGDDLWDIGAYTLINEAVLIGPEGVVGRYEKRNLWHPEREYLEPGTQHGLQLVFDTPWGKAGFLVCWDLSHPAAAQALVAQGAEIIFAPMYWLPTDSEPTLSKVNTHPSRATYELELVHALAQTRAFETECVLITCNAGAPGSSSLASRQPLSNDGERFMGGSGVWAPLLGRVAVCGQEEELRIVKVDMGVLAHARDLYKIREDADARDRAGLR